MIGLAFGGGVLLSRLTNGSRSHDGDGQPRQPMSAGFRSSSSATNYQMRKASSTVDNIGGALIGLLAGKVRGLIRDAIPGFDEEYRRVEQHKTSQTPNTDPA